MSKFLKQAFLAACVLFIAAPCMAAGKANTDQQYFERLLNAVCSAGDCSSVKQPDSPERARDILTTASYILYNSSREQLEKYNAPLKQMGIESALLIPAQSVENAVCQYYGYSINKHPELEKGANELAPHGFYTVGASDGGGDDYSIEKLTMLKNGVMRAEGKSMDDSPFVAYFGKSNCGGKPHWALLRVVQLRPSEEEEYYNSNLN